MRKVLLLLVVALFTMVGLALAQDTGAKETKTKAAAPAGQARWSGAVSRVDQSNSFLDVRKKTTEKRVHVTENTKWTKEKGKEAADPWSVKEGDRVICLGKYDGDKLMAEEIVLVTPKEK